MAYGVAGHTLWAISLSIAFAVAVVVAILLTLLVEYVASIESSVEGLLEVAGTVAANTAHIPRLQATAPVLAQLAEEAVIQDGYMNALTEARGDG
jgi:hypothetical protein